MITTLEGLKELDALLASKQNWCKGTNAKDSQGVPVTPFSENAIKWCLSGGIEKISFENDGTGLLSPNIRSALNKVLHTYNKSPSISLINYNDKWYRRFSGIKKLIAKAIVMEEQNANNKQTNS